MLTMAEWHRQNVPPKAHLKTQWYTSDMQTLSCMLDINLNLRKSLLSP